MENNQKKPLSKKITDPEKLKKHIKFSGKFSIGFGIGALILYLSAYFIDLIDIYAVIEISILAVIFVVIGILIIKNPTKSKIPLYAGLIIAIMYFILSGFTGWLLVAYAWFAYDGIRYLKRLGAQETKILETHE